MDVTHPFPPYRCISPAHCSDTCMTTEPAALLKLLDGGAEVDALTSGGQSALYIAAKSNQPQIVALLLQHSAQAGTVTHAGQTPLSIATTRGYSQVMQQLLEAGSPLEPRPRMAGSDAAKQCLVEWDRYIALPKWSARCHNKYPPRLQRRVVAAAVTLQRFLPCGVAVLLEHLANATDAHQRWRALEL